MDFKNKRKHFVKIDRDTTSEHALALLDAVGLDEEDKTDNLKNDSDTEFFVEEEITRYLCQLELYLGEKDEVELNLGESVVLKMCKVLGKSYCTVYFGNLFKSTLLISKLFKKGIYGVGITQSNRGGMPALPSDKEMKRGDFQPTNFQQTSAVSNGWITGPW